MQKGMKQDAIDVDFETSRSSPPERIARLPSHFAATFRYPNDDVAGSSRAASSLIVNAIKPDADQQAGPRKSQRKSTAIYADSDDDEEYRLRSGTSSPPKKSNERTYMKASSYDGDTHSPNEKVKVRKRIKRTRDDPNSEAGSIYAHLKGVPDLFDKYNDIMFCGINPGVKSSSSGHHFAHRSNHFYSSLHLAGITAERMRPEQDVEFPFLRPLSLGLTNLASRPTAEGSELLPSELNAGVPLLLDKIKKWKPRTVCFVGKGISEAFIKGLKQAGAIHDDAKGKRSRTFKSTSTRKNASGVKVEDGHSSLEAERDTRLVRKLLAAAIPSTVLCAHASTKPKREDGKLLVASPPSKPSLSPKKLIYTKSNPRDDTGYGILPICIPHTTDLGDGLSIDDVTLFFVTPSSSARVTTHFLNDKARILSSLRLLAEHVQLACSTSQNIPERLSGSQGHGHGNVDVEEDISLGNEPAGMQRVGTNTKLVELEVVDVLRFQTMVDEKPDGDAAFSDGMTVDV
ncbi:uncharacterized protein MEPE_02627 [Melanopsichium pennsylvanicum]|uniref:Uracil-DNA glycosylase-like domain-containing protein n=2 Tax=Melanopsichium pennsylvanicum TaxID=63383 RepID=A0AAJ4XJN7_9BASI|nr:dna glycosylase [Melanopsichium pennsylvanicum 4]SNX83919.1 uncharacterized protein MEPE_02627 [Melanopsichium pennsylvanicum]